MQYNLVILQDAEDDIFDIYQYISIKDSSTRADYVYTKLQETIFSLEQLPERGHIPPELECMGIYSFKEIHFKPYRIIYEIENRYVYIYCVLDGRRDIGDLLERRLLR